MRSPPDQQTHPPPLISLPRPPDFACRWAIVPPVAGSLVTIDVDYSTLLPGEALVLFLGSARTLVLTPGCCEGGGRYSATVVVESGLAVEFRTGDGGAGEISGTHGCCRGRGIDRGGAAAAAQMPLCSLLHRSFHPIHQSSRRIPHRLARRGAAGRLWAHLCAARGEREPITPGIN
jgi:hypothetical protein